MNMFTGELKVEAMAKVLTLLVEQHSTMRAHMMGMHRRMMAETMSAVADAPAGSAPQTGVSDDGEPNEMCLPPAN